MNLLRIGSTAVVTAALTVSGCGPQDGGGVRVAAPADNPTEPGPDSPAAKTKARTRVSAQNPPTGASSVP